MKNTIETILSQTSSQPRVLTMVTTLNGQLFIEENDEYRWIKDNYNAYYSVLDKSAPERLVLPYLQTMMAVLLFMPEPRTTLLLGAGGGAILRFLCKFIPDNTIQAIDYDNKVIEITEKFFMNVLYSDCAITNNDASHYISNSLSDSVDLILIDLFAHGSIPKFFNEVTFYEQCLRCSNSGVVVFNLIIESEYSFKSIMNLVFSVFNKRCLCLTVANYKNIIVLAFSESFEIETDVSVLREKCENLNTIYELNFDELLDEIITTNVSKDNKLQF